MVALRASQPHSKVPLGTGGERWGAEPTQGLHHNPTLVPMAGLDPAPPPAQLPHHTAGCGHQPLAPPEETGWEKLRLDRERLLFPLLTSLPVRTELRSTLSSGPALSRPPAGLSLSPPDKAGGTLRSSHGQNGHTRLWVSWPLISPEWLGRERGGSGDVHCDGHGCAAHPDLWSQEMGCGERGMGKGKWGMCRTGGCEEDVSKVKSSPRNRRRSYTRHRLPWDLHNQK